jgi:hypothetical protein
VNVFPAKQGYVIALTYGPGADWVRNVLTAGGCDVVIQGRTHRLTGPEVVHDEHRVAVPWAPRQFLGLVGVTDFLHLTERS